MGERISWSLNVDVSGGPKKTFSRTIDVDAYDKISVDIPAANSAGGSPQPGTMDVEVLPGTAPTSHLKLLLITAARYDERLTVAPATSEVPGNGVTGIPLAEPLLLYSEGAFRLLGGEAPPQSLTFSNGLDSPVKVDILVGRNVHEED